MKCEVKFYLTLTTDGLLTQAYDVSQKNIMIFVIYSFGTEVDIVTCLYATTHR